MLCTYGCSRCGLSVAGTARRNTKGGQLQERATPSAAQLFFSTFLCRLCRCGAHCGEGANPLAVFGGQKTTSTARQCSSAARNPPQATRRSHTPVLDAMAMRPAALGLPRLTFALLARSKAGAAGLLPPLLMPPVAVGRACGTISPGARRLRGRIACQSARHISAAASAAKKEKKATPTVSSPAEQQQHTVANSVPTFQQAIQRLQDFWSSVGCAIYLPHNTEARSRRAPLLLPARRWPRAAGLLLFLHIAGWRWDDEPRDIPTCAGPGAVECVLRGAQHPSRRQPLWRQPQSCAAPYAVPGREPTCNNASCQCACSQAYRLRTACV